MPSVPFSLRLDDATRARLEEEARHLDRPASQIAQRAIARYLDAQAALRQEIDAAAAEAEAGISAGRTTSSSAPRQAERRPPSPTR